MADGFFPLEQALDNWSEWGLPLTGRPAVLGPIPGGRTNRSYRLRAPGLAYDLLLRLNNPFGARLGIRRDDEARILEAVASAGLTPGACYWDPAQRFTLFPHIDARTWNPNDLQVPRQRQRLENCLEAVRDIRPPTPRRSYTTYLTHYWQQLVGREQVDSTLERRWQRFLPELEAFDCSDWVPVLTHHDLIPDNILDTGQYLYLIDWEYAAVGHPDIDRWCLDPSQVQEPFIHELARWTNDLWERVVRQLDAPQQPAKR